jgi:predicted phosphodiesterase
MRLRYFLVTLAALTLCCGCTNGSSSNLAENTQGDTTADSSTLISTKAKVAETFRFVVVGDSHSDTVDYQKVLEAATAEGPDFIIHVGDLTRVGDTGDLRKAKQLLDQTGISYYAIPGDHDVVNSKNTDNFQSVFSQPYQAFDHNGFRFILLDNSNSQSSFGEQQWKFIRTEVETSEPLVLFMHNPLSNPLIIKHTMEETAAGKQDSHDLLSLLQDKQVAQLFSGEMHFFQQYVVGNNFPLTIVGTAGTFETAILAEYCLAIAYDDGTIAASTKVVVRK